MENFWQLLIAFIAGLGGGVGLKVVFDRSKKNVVIQKANRVGGDQAGRDIHK